jgi:hypothetical protein
VRLQWRKSFGGKTTGKGSFRNGMAIKTNRGGAFYHPTPIVFASALSPGQM